MRQSGAIAITHRGNAMSKSADEIRAEIERDREDAAERIDQLEERLQDTADDVRREARYTVDEVRDEAQDVVNNAVDSVKETLDIQHQVQERPLVAVAGAMVGGYLVGSMMSDSGDSGGGQSSGPSMGERLQKTAKESGLLDTLQNFAAALVGSYAEEVKTMVKPTKQQG